MADSPNNQENDVPKRFAKCISLMTDSWKNIIGSVMSHQQYSRKHVLPTVTDNHHIGRMTDSLTVNEPKNDSRKRFA